MSTAAFRAFQAKNAEFHFSHRYIHEAPVIPMDVQTADMAAGVEAVNMK